MLFLSGGLSVDGGLLSALKDMFMEFGVLSVLGIMVFFWLLYLLTPYVKKKLINNATDPDGKDKKIRTLEDALARQLQLHGSSIDDQDTLSESFSLTTASDLKKHPFFSNIDYILRVKANQTIFSSSIKKRIFKDYLRIKYGIFRDRFIEFLDNGDIDNLTREEFKMIFTKLLIDIDDEVSVEISKKNMPFIATVELNKSSLIGDKIIHSSVSTFCESKNFRSAKDIIYTILNLATEISQVIFHEMVLNLEKLNGSLEKEIYGDD